MGWDIATKSVIRENPEYTGATVWSLDQQNGRKIIATRHDHHDQDLADAISATLNLDGINQMRAALNVGGFKVTNMAKGTAQGDGVRFGQIITGATFDDPTRTLTLSSTDEADITVVIPSGSGGGGSGTVISIDIGEGLDGATDPITVSGDIKLETIGSLQTFTGGIKDITIDKHGRVTQVIEGAYANTNLSITNKLADTFRLNSSTGTDVTVPKATQTEAGLMSAGDKVQLDALAAASGTDITLDYSTTTVEIQSSTGANATIAEATGFLAGVMSAADKLKLNGIDKDKLDAIEALADVTDAENVDAAGAIMDSDVDTSGDGFIYRLGPGNYGTRVIAVGTGLSIADAGGGLDNPTISLDMATYTAVGGVDDQRVYIQGSAPSGASLNDIWIDVS